MSENSNSMSAQEQQTLIEILKSRFEKNPDRHASLSWQSVQQKLAEQPRKLCALHEMEGSGGEPDVINYDAETGEFLFVDCSPETPKNRRSLCYDRAALESRKEQKPKNSAIDMAVQFGAELLSEAEYQMLHRFGTFDTKTSSWLKTPDAIRKLGGAIFGDYRFGRVFIYHNGAESYYAARGFRCMLRV